MLRTFLIAVAFLISAFALNQQTDAQIRFEINGFGFGTYQRPHYNHYHYHNSPYRYYSPYQNNYRYHSPYRYRQSYQDRRFHYHVIPYNGGVRVFPHYRW